MLLLTRDRQYFKIQNFTTISTQQRFWFDELTSKQERQDST